MSKYLIKGEFLLRGIKLWDFIFDKYLFQLSEWKSCLFITNLTIQKNTSCMSHCSVLALDVQSFSKEMLSPWSQSVLPVFWKEPRKTRKWNQKYSESSLKLTFGRDDCHKPTTLPKISLDWRLELIFNNMWYLQFRMTFQWLFNIKFNEPCHI